MNVQSIDNNGMLMPIRVNDKFLEKTGFYELICGEGRLIAHQRLGKSEIMAEVVTCTRKEAYLQSLIENLARSRPGTMEFARELKQLHDEGWDYARIGKTLLPQPGVRAAVYRPCRERGRSPDPRGRAGRVSHLVCHPGRPE